MTHPLTAKLDPELALCLVKNRIPVRELDEMVDKYRKRQILENYDGYVVGQRLREERKLSGLTQMEVAEALGVCHQTVSMWETGKADLTLRDAHRLMMLYRRIPGERNEEYEEPNLNDLTWTPMTYLAKAGNGDWTENVA